MSDQLRAFGEREPGLDYRPRAAAYGVVLRDGQIALVRQGFSNFTYDLPGGAVDPGETHEQALRREFLEETGLEVEAGAPVGEVLQYFINADGKPWANHACFYRAEITGERPEAKIEEDHELVWMPVLDTLVHLEKEGYAWALLKWLRQPHDHSILQNDL